MADEARPLSRRERREMEEQAAAGLAPVPAASGARADRDNAVAEGADASGLTRRDRRRLERLEQPMETWTAVEEAHHTGQVPTMTPEVIAQQEELARRRAAEAQADALAATGGIRQVGPRDVAAAVISRYDMPDEVPDPSHSESTRSATSGPGDDARRRLAQAAAEAAAQLPVERERPPAPVRREPGTIDAPRPLTAEVPSLADLTPPSGIRSTQGPAPQGMPPSPPQDGFPAQGMPNPQTGSLPSPYPLGAPPPPYPGAPGAPAGAPVAQSAMPVAQPAPPVAQPAPPVGQAAPPVGHAQAPGELGVAPPPTNPPIPAPVHPSAPLPVAGQVVSGAPQGGGAPPPPYFGPPTGAIPVQGGQAQYPPGTALSPIVTGMLRPVPGATGTMRAIPGGGPMTGTIPRPIIEVQPAGGAKEFGWPHIALLAAAAFVLGLVVWKISGLGG